MPPPYSFQAANSEHKDLASAIFIEINKAYGIFKDQNGL